MDVIPASGLLPGRLSAAIPVAAWRWSRGPGWIPRYVAACGLLSVIGGRSMAPEPSQSEPHRMRCPECHQVSMHRVRRSGFLENWILPKFGYYPWECPNCEIKKILKARGRRMHRR